VVVSQRTQLGRIGELTYFCGDNLFHHLRSLLTAGTQCSAGPTKEGAGSTGYFRFRTCLAAKGAAVPDLDLYRPLFAQWEGQEEFKRYYDLVRRTRSSVPTGFGSALRLLEAITHRTNPPRVIFVSSGGTVYGKLRHVPVREDHPLAPLTAYGASKAAVELYLNHYRAVYGLDCRVARLANPYGAGRISVGPKVPQPRFCPGR